MIVLFIASICGVVACLVWTWMAYEDNKKSHMVLSVILAVVLVVVSVVLFNTAQVHLYWTKFKVGAKKGTWIVVDNSGGKTLRHWILYDNYVKGADQTDGWEFFAESCSPCYVGGDAFVGKITREQIDGDYRRQFNIPADQEALH